MGGARIFAGTALTILRRHFLNRKELVHPSSQNFLSLLIGLFYNLTHKLQRCPYLSKFGGPSHFLTISRNVSIVANSYQIFARNSQKIDDLHIKDGHHILPYSLM